MNSSASHEVRLPRPPGVLRRAFAAHPLAVDVTIVVFYLLGCAMMALIDGLSGSAGGVMAIDDTSSGFPSYLSWPALLLTLLRVGVVAMALLLRRRFPLLGLIVVVLALFGAQGAQSLPNGVALCFMLYAVPVYRSVPAGWVGYTIAVLASVPQALFESMRTGVALGNPAAILAVAPRSAGDLLWPLIISAIWLMAVLMIGINIGNRRRYLDAIIDRAHQLARERDQLAQLAVAEERSRIAREMHDIVAHSVSVMIALSEGASRAVAAAPEAAADAMQRSAETGRTALAEMRRLLGALHQGDEPEIELTPQPGVRDLDALVAGFSDAGLRVTLDVTGEIAGDRGQELAVYRIAQESLTNVLRYAGVGARAEVRVRLCNTVTVVEVRDYGVVPGARGSTASVGSGLGLAGLAERVRVFGGRIESGPVPALEGAGWRVRAELPVNDAAREYAPGETPAVTEIDRGSHP